MECRSRKTSRLCYSFLHNIIWITAVFTTQIPCAPTADRGIIRTAILQGRNPPPPFLQKAENLSDGKPWNFHLGDTQAFGNFCIYMTTSWVSALWALTFENIPIFKPTLNMKFSIKIHLKSWHVQSFISDA